MELIYIPKEYFNSESDEVFYLSKHEVYHICFQFLFKFKGYYIYYRNLGFNIYPYLNVIKIYIKDMFKENDMNLTNVEIY